jgi:hypothetical protein
MTAEQIARALNGHRSGSGWMERCPAHDNQRPSLSIDESDGLLLVHCFAGCSQTHVSRAQRPRALGSEFMPNCDFAEIFGRRSLPIACSREAANGPSHGDLALLRCRTGHAR